MDMGGAIGIYYYYYFSWVEGLTHKELNSSLFAPMLYHEPRHNLIETLTN